MLSMMEHEIMERSTVAKGEETRLGKSALLARSAARIALAQQAILEHVVREWRDVVTWKRQFRQKGGARNAFSSPLGNACRQWQIMSTNSPPATPTNGIEDEAPDGVALEMAVNGAQSTPDSFEESSGHTPSGLGFRLGAVTSATVAVAKATSMMVPPSPSWAVGSKSSRKAGRKAQAQQNPVHSDPRRNMLIPIVQNSQHELRKWAAQSVPPMWIFIAVRGMASIAIVILLLEKCWCFRFRQTAWVRTAYALGGPNCIAILLPLAQLDRSGSGSISDEAMIEYDKQIGKIIFATLTALQNATIVSTLILGALGFALGDMVDPVETIEFRVHYSLTMCAAMMSLGGVVASIGTFKAINLHMPDDEAKLRFMLNYRLVVNFASSLSPYIQSCCFVSALVMGAWTVSTETGIIASAAVSILLVHIILFHVIMQYNALVEQHLAARELTCGIDDTRADADRPVSVRPRGSKRRFMRLWRVNNETNW